MKESTNSAEIFICRRGHRTLLTAVVMARSDNVFVEKRRSEDFRDGESLEQYLRIWRSQNRYESANDRGNTLERYVDGFYELETMRFHGLLSFQLDFQLESLSISPPGKLLNFPRRKPGFQTSKPSVAFGISQTA